MVASARAIKTTAKSSAAASSKHGVAPDDDAILVRVAQAECAAWASEMGARSNIVLVVHMARQETMIRCSFLC